MRRYRPWFANKLVEHYCNDTEPKLFPHAYTQYIDIASFHEIEKELSDLRKQLDEEHEEVKTSRKVSYQEDAIRWEQECAKLREQNKIYLDGLRNANDVVLEFGSSIRTQNVIRDAINKGKEAGE